jgi:hypothetical protein
MKKRVWIGAVMVALAVLAAIGIPRLRAEMRRAKSMNCASFMSDICLCASVWAEEHGDALPSNLSCISNQLGVLRPLVCPADKGRRPATNWSSFTPANSSYEIISPGMHLDETNRVFIRCTVHGHLGYSDATVFDGVRRRHKIE